MAKVITYDAGKDFQNTNRFLRKMKTLNVRSQLISLAKEGVNALAAATPIDSGVTKDSWSYTIEYSPSDLSITWRNDESGGNRPVVILLQYGHATGTGGYVRGRDFINPAIKPIFDRIAEQTWKVVTSA